MKQASNIPSYEQHEFIALLGLLKQLQLQGGKLCYSKAFLILPFLSNPELFAVLKDRRVRMTGIYDFMIKHSKTLVFLQEDFNRQARRLPSLLELAQDGGLIQLGTEIELLPEGENFLKQLPASQKKVADIIHASEKLSLLLQGDNTQLYFTLRLEI